MTSSQLGGPVVKLRLLRAGTVVRTYKLRKEVVTIGAAEGCTVRAAGDPNLAAIHATVYIEEGELTIVPEPGAQLLLNGEPADVVIPQPNDVIKVGRLAFHVELAQTMESLAPPPARAAAGHQRSKPSVPRPQAPAKESLLKQTRPETPSEQALFKEEEHKPSHPEPKATIDEDDLSTTYADVSQQPKVLDDDELVTASQDGSYFDFDEKNYFDTDDDEEDELLFEPPFDLAKMLLQPGDPEGAGAMEPYLAAQVVRVTGNQLTTAASVLPGQSYRSNTGEVGCRVVGSRVQLIIQKGLDGTRFTEQGQAPLAAEPDRAGLQRVFLGSGDRVMLRGDEGTYQISVFRPPLAPKVRPFKPNPRFVWTMLFAVLVHLVASVAVAMLGLQEPEKQASKEEEVYAVVQMDHKQPEKPPEPVREKKIRRKDTLSMSEKAPAISNRTIRSIREREKPSKSTSVNSLLQVLARGSGTPGKSDKLKDLISNIDAVASSGSSGSSFSIAGAIAGLPGDGVNIARQGGGGIISTLSGDQVAGKGTGVGTLTRSKKRGKVRGKVTKMSSSARVGGSLSRSEVLRVINSHMHAIQACYERALMRNPTLSGRIAFDWTVSKTGRVKGVRVRSSTLGNAKVAGCINALIKRWKFPRPKGGEATITYPFLFRAVN
ncbi:MAG: AgmX/PglI C-terminal domain-containing protein [Myxococcota bacterium]|nr:AgmX/PglI C-terminal domain-containing protein [Myxococcota bacterium]